MPDEFFSNMTNLNELKTAGNNWNSSIPSSLKRASNIRLMWIDNSGWTGTIPDDLFANMPLVSDIQFQNNGGLKGIRYSFR
jgi:hypothetical protein